MFSDILAQQLKEAMRAQDAQRTSTLRLLISAMKYRQIEASHPLSDEEALAVVGKELKSLRDSLASFEAGARSDLADKAKQEIAILEAFLPAQMSDADLEAAVRSAIAEVGATSKADIGKVMGAAKKIVGSSADGARIKVVVDRQLQH